MIVTVITRRPYGGRVLQRVWLNEDEIMDKIRVKYKDLNQMKTTIESDMIISMHGAGLVNVLWARPMTMILEIFPKERFRWGYRNLCQFVGCDWHQFRVAKTSVKIRFLTLKANGFLTTSGCFSSCRFSTVAMMRTRISRAILRGEPA
ncbi:Glycosyltransferase AER61, uncharacterized [Phytophthora cactorum]|nr:Glycosyltransferase AER61, uncharacterized [Phytophthora cactorum]